MAGGGGALAQSSAWDAIISNSNWYVTVPQMLAYAAPSTSFADPVPIGDQTLWSLGTSVNGVFSGTSTGQLQIGPIVSTSYLEIHGVVTTDGMITMLFTPATGVSTIGLGQMQQVGDVTTMEMQMITGTSLLVTHWAYMTPYDPATFTPPTAQVVPSNASPQWAWTAGTPWRVVSPALFGSAAPGTVVFTNYKSGYFWGVGVGPDGNPNSSFTVLGSITPQGKVLFNVIQDGTLVSLYGAAEGDPAAAQMLLGSYDIRGIFTGDITGLSLVPAYSRTVAAAQNPSAVGAATALYSVAGTSDGLFGPLAPVIGQLNTLQGAALNAAVSQTVPVLSGAAAQATFNTQRITQQLVQDRIDTLQQDDRGSARNAWIKPFGSLATQSTQDGVPGYHTAGGGFIAGLDRVFAPGVVAGGSFSYAYNQITSYSGIAPSSLDTNTYQIGLYGSIASPGGFALDLEADLGLNQNATSRAIAFMGSTATADYTGNTVHVGGGMRQMLNVAPGTSLAPQLRLDYAQVRAGSYAESGAGALNLQVSSQLYQELVLSAGLRGAYRLANGMQLTAKGAVGYNALDNETQITAFFAGGGPTFVTSGPEVSPWLLSGGIGLAGPASDTLDLGVYYDVQASPSGFFSQLASVAVKMKF
ncbi:autotransporter outer membrane beta-barrel domain-containing protein [Aquabacter spiritensis]|uniref:autotransporter family protein n=1 Tax=Aquabacter spiritensis TaxID=933073 RepID=UPI001404A4C4|nr:autotransporter outer membrane beta-barrel domain-containing protein [Aquabacter spiritensis]